MSLLSLEFITLSLVAIVVVRATSGWIRVLGFGALSLWFLTSYVDAVGLVSILVFCLSGYGFAVISRHDSRLGTVGIVLLTAGFIWIRRYSFLDLLLPESLLSFSLLTTAGLSFLFFKIIHVIVDTQGGTIKDLRLTTYLLYCLNFTAYLLGPIQRYQGFEGQWNRREDPVPPTFEAQLDAVNRVLRGMVKKFVVAEWLASYALLPGTSVETMGLGEVAIGTYVFYFFLYFDFSGYCDIMIGVGGLMGVRPPENFHLPFLSPNVAQFWLRVHRSLTLWLTDYVFNPVYAQLLRYSRTPGPLLGASLAIMLTMIVSGLWHGTTLSFLLFGILHGAYLIVFRVFEWSMIRRVGRRKLAALRKAPAWITVSTLLTFNVTAAAYVFFVVDADGVLALTVRAWTKVFG